VAAGRSISLSPRSHSSSVLEEPLAPAGNEIFVRRQYFKLVNHATLLKGFVSERVPLNDGDTVKSGERVKPSSPLKRRIIMNTCSSKI